MPALITILFSWFARLAPWVVGLLVPLFRWLGSLLYSGGKTFTYFGIKNLLKKIQLIFFFFFFAMSFNLMSTLIVFVFYHIQLTLGVGLSLFCTQTTVNILSYFTLGFLTLFLSKVFYLLIRK